MEVIKILVVEDELIIALNICDYLREIGYKVVKHVTTYEKAIDCLNFNKPDIAILDIKIKGEKTGIDIAKYIHDNRKIPFIFLTSITDKSTLKSAISYNPSAYLVKPFSREDLFTSIELALHNFHPSLDSKSETADFIEKDAFIIKCNNHYTKVPFNEIIYIKSDHVYAELFTKKEGHFLLRSTMKGLLEKLPEEFYQVHRSYIVNTSYVDSASRQTVKLMGTDIPIGRNYYTKLTNFLQYK